MKPQLFMSLGAVGLVIGTIGVIVAAVSPQWIVWKVDRQGMQRNREVIKKLESSFEHNPIYFSRNIGLYYICFPDRVPSEIGSFNWFWTPCIVNPDYNPDSTTYEAYTTPQIHRFWLMWLMLACYALAIIFLLLTMAFGVSACWKQKSRRLGVTTVLLFLGILFLACVALLWHFILYYEHNAIRMPSFPSSWDTSLRQSSLFSYGMGYLTFIASCVVLILSGLGFALAWYYVKRKSEDENDKHLAYLHYVNTSDKAMMPYNPYGAGTYPQNYYPNYYSQQNPYGAGTMSNYYGYLTYN